MSDGNEKYGVRLRSLNRYNVRDKTYNFGKTYMVSREERALLLDDPNGNYFEDVLVTTEDYIFVNDGPHVLALRNGLPGTHRVLPPAVAVAEVVNPPVGTEVANIEPPAASKGGLRLKSNRPPAAPREIVAGEPSPTAPDGTRDSGANAVLGPDMGVPADISDAGVEV